VAIPLGDAIVQIKGDTSGLQKDIDRAKQKTLGLGSAIKAGLAGGVGFFGMQQAVQGLGGIFDMVKGSVFGMNATLETSTLQFETLMGNADEAKKHVEDLFVFAKKTPFETEPVIEASRMMRTFGGDALDTMQNLTMVGDAAAATSTDINEIAFWTGRLYAALQSGRPIGEAATRLQELAVLSPQARNEIDKLTAAGASGDELWTVFTNDMGKFGGAMAKQAGTWAGLTSTFSDTIKILSATALKPFFDLGKKGLESLNELLGSEGVAKTVERFATSLAKNLDRAGKAIGPPLKLAASVTKTLVQWLRTFLKTGDELNDFFADLPGPVKVAALVLAEIVRQVRALLDFARPLAQDIGRLIDRFTGFELPLERAGNRLEFLGRDVLPLVSGAILTFIGVLAFNTVASFVGGIASMATQFVTFPIKAAAGVASTVKDFVSAAAGMVSKSVKITQTIVRAGASLISGLVDMTQNITQFVRRGGEKLIEDFGPKVQDILQKVGIEAKPKVSPEGIGQKLGLNLAGGIVGGLGVALGAGVNVSAIAGSIGSMLAAVGAAVAGVISAPVLIIAGIIVAAILAGFLIYKFREPIAKFFQKVFGAIRDFLSDPARVGRFLGRAAALFAIAIASILFPPLLPTLLLIRFREQVGGFLARLGGVFRDLLSQLPIADIAQWIAIALFPPLLLVKFREQVMGFVSQIPGVLGAVARAILGELAALPGQVLQILMGMPQFFLDLFTVYIPQAVTQGMPLTIRSVLKEFLALPGQIGGLLQLVVGTVVGWIGQLASMFSGVLPWEWIKGAWEGFKQGIADILDALLGKGATGAIGNWFANVASLLSMLLPWNWVSTAFDGLKIGVTTILDDVVTAFTEWPGRIIDALKELPVKLLQAGKDAMQGFVDGLKSIPLPDITPGFDIPGVPGLQQGIRRWPGGVALLGEKGPEIAAMPTGTTVVPAAQTARLLENLGRGRGINLAPSFEINIQAAQDWREAKAQLLRAVERHLDEIAATAGIASPLTVQGAGIPRV